MLPQHRPGHLVRVEGDVEQAVHQPRIQAVLGRTSSGGYFIGTGGGIRSDSGSTASQEIAAWVADNFTATTVGGVTVYDLHHHGSNLGAHPGVHRFRLAGIPR